MTYIKKKDIAQAIKSAVITERHKHLMVKHTMQMIIDFLQEEETEGKKLKDIDMQTFRDYIQRPLNKWEYWGKYNGQEI